MENGGVDAPEQREYVGRQRKSNEDRDRFKDNKQKKANSINWWVSKEKKTRRGESRGINRASEGERRK